MSDEQIRIDRVARRECPFCGVKRDVPHFKGASELVSPDQCEVFDECEACGKAWYEIYCLSNVVESKGESDE